MSKKVTAIEMAASELMSVLDRLLATSIQGWNGLANGFTYSNSSCGSGDEWRELLIRPAGALWRGVNSWIVVRFYRVTMPNHTSRWMPLLGRVSYPFLEGLDGLDFTCEPNATGYALAPRPTTDAWEDFVKKCA